MRMPDIMPDERGQTGLDQQAIAIVVLVITLGIGSIILSQMQGMSVVNSSSNASETIGQGLSGLSLMSSFVVIIALVIVASVVIEIVRRIG